MSTLSSIWQAIVFPLGFLIFGVSMILSLMRVNVVCDRRQMVVVYFCLAVMCIGFALTGDVTLWPKCHSALVYTVTRLSFTVAITLIGSNVVRRMIALHSNIKNK